MIVHIPSPLRSYTKSAGQIDIDAVALSRSSQREIALADVTAELERQFPGIRFRMIDEQDRIRQHIKIFVNRQEVKTLEVPLNSTDVVHITCALSGG